VASLAPSCGDCAVGTSYAQSVFPSQGFEDTLQLYREVGNSGLSKSKSAPSHSLSYVRYLPMIPTPERE
jgi:hypothetical protein